MHLKKVFVRSLFGSFAAAAIGTACQPVDGEGQTVKSQALTTPTMEVKSPVPESFPPEASAETPLVEPELKLALPVSNEDSTNYWEEALRLKSEDAADAEILKSLRKHFAHNSPTVDGLLWAAKLTKQPDEQELKTIALKEALSIAPDDIQVNLQTARHYFASGEHFKAFRYARRAAELDELGGGNSAAWNLVGRIAMEANQWQRAEAAFNKAIDLAPDMAIYYNNRGLLYIKSHKAEAAVDDLEMAIGLYGESHVPHFVWNNLGLAHEMAGHLDDARDCFEEAVLVKPFYTRARVNLDRIEQTIVYKRKAEAVETAFNVDAEAMVEEQTPSEELPTVTPVLRGERP